MTTRSGKSYKQSTMEEMQGMLKLLVEDRRKREEEFEAERARMVEERQRRERETGKQMEELRAHLESLMKVVADSRKPEVVSQKRELSVKLVPLTEKYDIEAYLVTFERIMAAHRVEKDCWSQYLAPQLTGRAQLAFAALPLDDSGDYDAIKLAILQRYDITEEAYRRRFRQATRGSGETNRELAVRLMDLLGKWLKECTSLEEDTQWNDIDYMHSNLDFTYDMIRYGELPSLVEDLHSYGQKYVIIVDPGISSQLPPGQYAPFDDGLKSNVFVMNSTGQPLIGAVWPGSTAWPDFTHPNASSYWTNQISCFQSEVAFDGLWIDMNEPSDFVDGSDYGCPNSQLEHPPYLPFAMRSLRNGIFTKTLCMTANQFLSVHYNLHSLYGLTEANATMSALTTVLNKRSLVISRSTYPGSGAHGGHWLGDNASEWPDLAVSIPGLLQFSLFGVPLVGADICGFNGNTTQELCTRWQQLGAFYPFSRNHNSIGMADQDPAVFDDASVNSTRDALLLRYQLLPFLYTLFYFAHTNGSTVARPLFFEFPADSNTWSLDTQFMWGGSLLISPVLAENTSSVEAYFPEDRWFELRTGMEMAARGQTVLLSAPYGFIPLHVRGGAVIPMQAPNTTTAQSRKNPFSLLVVLSDQATASGYLYLDDGESLDIIETEDYSLIQYSVMEGFLGSELIGGHGCSVAGVAVLGGIQVFGLTSPPTTVSMNGTVLPNASIEWDQTNKVLGVQLTISNMNYAFNVTWR